MVISGYWGHCCPVSVSTGQQDGLRENVALSGA